jgi:hypothetical protein
MSQMPGNVNKLRHEDIHPDGAKYAHANFPLTVYHKTKKVEDEGKNKIAASKIVRSEAELEAAEAEGYAPLGNSLAEETKE